MAPTPNKKIVSTIKNISEEEAQDLHQRFDGLQAQKKILCRINISKREFVLKQRSHPVKSMGNIKKNLKN